jgi:hypothetical protein
MGKVMQPFRLSLVGAKGPHLFDIVEVMERRNHFENSESNSNFVILQNIV